MKHVIIAIGLLVAVGCAAASDEFSVNESVANESFAASGAAETLEGGPGAGALGTLESALQATTYYCSINAGNCKGRCVQAMGCCIRAGVPREECVAERDACFADCEEPPPPPPGECHLPDCPF